MVLTIEQRLTRLEARAEIQDLAARYFLATDDDDWQTLADCFTADASFAASGFGEVSGRDNVIALLRQARSGMGQTVHTIDYAHVELEHENRAGGTVTAHLELGMGEQTVYGAVRYIDRYEREDGRWAIASREMKAVHIGIWGNVQTSLSTSLNVRWPGADPAPSECPRPSV